MFNRKERESSPESDYRAYNGAAVGAGGAVGAAGVGGAAGAGPVETQHVAPDRVRFARDTSHYWYKPNISRDDGNYCIHHYKCINIRIGNHVSLGNLNYFWDNSS